MVCGVLDRDIIIKTQEWREVWSCWNVGMGCCVVVVSGALDWDITFKAQGWCEVWGCWGVGMGCYVVVVSGTSHHITVGRGANYHTNNSTLHTYTTLHYLTLPHKRKGEGPTTIQTAAHYVHTLHYTTSHYLTRGKGGQPPYKQQ